ncbi:MAG: GNAT family N-acetyltransferase, partial [Waterburya sp.]
MNNCEIKQVNLAMFPQFYPLLREINPELSATEWYSLFTPQWDQPEKFCGYGLFDETEIVGFLGFIFSQRIINGQLENFCNLTSWIVKEPYRGRGISLFLALRKLMKDYTIT